MAWVFDPSQAHSEVLFTEGLSVAGPYLRVRHELTSAVFTAGMPRPAWQQEHASQGHVCLGPGCGAHWCVGPHLGTGRNQAEHTSAFHEGQASVTCRLLWPLACFRGSAGLLLQQTYGKTPLQDAG